MFFTVEYHWDKLAQLSNIAYIETISYSSEYLPAFQQNAVLSPCDIPKELHDAMSDFENRNVID